MGQLLAIGFTIIGVGLYITSNAMYIRRTKDRSLRQFFLARRPLTRNEYLLNRWGLGLVIFAMLLRVLEPG